MTIDTMTPLFEINAGDTAWVLASASLVLFMTPMLAFFYGGMVRAKGVLNMLMMNVVAMGTIGVLWVVCGYSMAFGDPQWGGLIGNPAQYFELHGVMGTEVGTIPGFVFVAFQSAFAIIATALVSGAVCALAVSLKYRFSYDDSLDAVGVHMVGGFLGTVLIGFLADPHAMAEGASASLEANGAGLFLGGNGKLLGSRSSVPSR
ncbi:hypothetical protein APY06_08970 [Cutibacterium avidum]|nr:hypothetical protein APY06_08970 [Cutibacterium avidum]